MLIVDDGSTDRTGEVAHKYSTKETRITYFQQQNQGAAVARNNAIRQAKGKYLTFLDSDDTYLPDGLRHLVTAIASAPPEVKLVYGDFIIFDEQAGTRRPITATPPVSTA